MRVDLPEGSYLFCSWAPGVALTIFGFLIISGSLYSSGLLRALGSLYSSGLLRALGSLTPFGLLHFCGSLASRRWGLIYFVPGPPRGDALLRWVSPISWLARHPWISPTYWLALVYRNVDILSTPIAIRRQKKKRLAH